MAKRLMDLVAAGVGVMLLSPALAIIALAVLLTTGRPVLFRDRRTGKDGRPFDLLKFRTMRDLRPGERIPDHDAIRVSPIGRFLRSTSLDELPALFNVLRGDMSLIGPRPLPVRYTERYTPFQARRLEVRPGISGWAQVNGRNLVSWDQRFEMDVWYVDNRSFRLDLSILAKTVRTVFGRQGVSPSADYTMPEFTGGGSD